MEELEQIGNIIESETGKLENVPVKGNPNGLPTKGTMGGPRPGGGMPPGKVTKKKLEQMKVKNKFNQLVMRSATKLFNAQLNLAVGEQSLFVKYYTGKSKDRKKHIDIVTDIELIKEYIIDDGLTLNNNGDEEYYFLSTKPSNNMAIDSLLNRALGKAPEKLEITGGFFSKSKLTIEVLDGREQENSPRLTVESTGKPSTPTIE
jgi:hypothetical protein